MKLVAMYNLKKSTNFDEFKKWSKEVDQKMVSKQPGYRRFDVLEARAILDGSKPPYKQSETNLPFKVIEFIEVESQQALEKSQTSPAMSGVMKKWLDFVDESSVIILKVEEI